MDSQAVPGTRPPSLLSRMKVTSEHQETEKQSKTKQNPNYPQTPDSRSLCVWRPRACTLSPGVERAELAARDGAGRGARLGATPLAAPTQGRAPGSPSESQQKLSLCPPGHRELLSRPLAGDRARPLP